MGPEWGFIEEWINVCISINTNVLICQVYIRKRQFCSLLLTLNTEHFCDPTCVCMCFFFSPTLTNSPTLACCAVIKLDHGVLYLEWVSNSTDKGLSPTRLYPTSDLIISPSLHLQYIWSIGYILGVPITPSSASIICSNGLWKSRKCFAY